MELVKKEGNEAFAITFKEVEEESEMLFPFRQIHSQINSAIGYTICEPDLSVLIDVILENVN